MSRIWGSLSIAGLLAAIAVAGCRDFHLSTGGLDLGPNPALPGQTVVASFVLNLIPAQQHTIRVFIDDSEHLKDTRTGTPPLPVIVEIGEAGDLIAEYGAGTHVVYIEIEAQDSGRSTRTRPAGLELQESTGEEAP
jgi:hypothetical protein